MLVYLGVYTNTIKYMTFIFVCMFYIFTMTCSWFCHADCEIKAFIERKPKQFVAMKIIINILLSFEIKHNM